MRIARLVFDRTLLMHSSSGGIPISLFNDMIKHLPEDARFVGCDTDMRDYTRPSSMDYMMFTSKMFKDIEPAGLIPMITAHFKRDFDPLVGDLVTCTGIDISEALCPTYVDEFIFGESKPPVCAHQWSTYHGLNEQYEYCTICNTRRD